MIILSFFCGISVVWVKDERKCGYCGAFEGEVGISWPNTQVGLHVDGAKMRDEDWHCRKARISGCKICGIVDSSSEYMWLIDINTEIE